MESEIDIIPQSGDHLHSCGKVDCFFCYEMNRINQPKEEYKWAKKTTYQNRRQKEFKAIFEKYKAA